MAVSAGSKIEADKNILKMWQVVNGKSCSFKIFQGWIIVNAEFFVNVWIPGDKAHCAWYKLAYGSPPYYQQEALSEGSSVTITLPSSGNKVTIKCDSLSNTTLTVTTTLNSTITAIRMVNANSFLQNEVILASQVPLITTFTGTTITLNRAYLYLICHTYGDLHIVDTTKGTSNIQHALLGAGPDAAFLELAMPGNEQAYAFPKSSTEMQTGDWSGKCTMQGLTESNIAKVKFTFNYSCSCLILSCGNY